MQGGGQMWQMVERVEKSQIFISMFNGLRVPSVPIRSFTSEGYLSAPVLSCRLGRILGSLFTKAVLTNSLQRQLEHSLTPFQRSNYGEEGRRAHRACRVEPRCRGRALLPRHPNASNTKTLPRWARQPRCRSHSICKCEKTINRQEA